MVLCFSDPNQKVIDEDVANIFRLCDQNNIPYASNVATAELLVPVSYTHLDVYKRQTSTLFACWFRRFT